MGPDQNPIWEQFKKGDKKAYAHIYYQYFDHLYDYGCRLSAHTELVEDCIQELFIRLWKRKEQLHEVESVSKPKGTDSEVSVQINPKKIKFIVYSQDILIEVLGTAFSINNRREETSVILQSGEVKIKKGEQQTEEMVMQPGEMITYSHNSGQLTKTKVDPTVKTSWKDRAFL